MPLPNCALLEMAFHLCRLVSLSAAAEDLRFFESDVDDDGSGGAARSQWKYLDCSSRKNKNINSLLSPNPLFEKRLEYYTPV